MSRESEFAARMAGDTALMAILTGGVFEKALTGVEGIARETAPTAFDGAGYLLPCALVRQRDEAPDGVVRDFIAQMTSSVQIIEIYLYADAGQGYSAIDAAKARLYTLFEGYVLASAFETQWINSLPNLRDMGALKNAAMSRIDFVVYGIKS